MLRAERLTRQAVLAHERGRVSRRRRLLCTCEALDDARQSRRVAAAHDPLEEPSMLVRDVERRVSRADTCRRVREPQKVAVGHTRTPAVLHCLVGESVRRLRRIPPADRASERAAPAAELLDERRELEQMRSRSRDLRQRLERGLARGLVGRARRERKRKERRFVLRRAALTRDAHDLRDRTQTVLGHCLLDRLCVLAGQRPLGGVVRASLRAEDQEPAQARPDVDRPRVSTGRVRHLAAERQPLRHATRAVLLQIVHRVPPFVVCVRAAVVVAQTV